MSQNLVFLKMFKHVWEGTSVQCQCVWCVCPGLLVKRKKGVNQNSVKSTCTHTHTSFLTSDQDVCVLSTVPACMFFLFYPFRALNR